MQVLIPLAFVALLSTAVVGQDFRTPIGSPCTSDPVDDGCVINGECLFSLCQCKDGYSVTSSFTCKLDFGGNCTTSDDCNTQMGLECIDSVCGCSNVAKQEYLSELGTCVNSTMKLMFEDIVAFINQTELELTKFSTLLQIFMIHGTAENETSETPTPPGDIQNSVDVPLRELDEQIESPQEPIPATVLPPTTTSSTAATLPTTDSLGPPPAIPALAAQLPEDTPTTTAGTTTTTAAPTSPTTVPSTVVAPQGVPIPVRPTANLPNSLNNLIVPILPTQGNSDSSSPQVSEGTPLQNPSGVNSNQQINNLANVLPQFLAMFKEFVPMLQSYNNILSSSLFTIPPSRSGSNNNLLSGLVRGAGSAGNNIIRNFNPVNTLGNSLGNLGSSVGNLRNSLGSSVGNLGSSFGNLGNSLGNSVGNLGNIGNLGGLGNLGTVGNLGNSGRGSPAWSLFPSTRRPSLLQIPGRIFNSVFGRNSTVQNLKRRIIPFNSNDSNRLIPFLPIFG